MKHGSQALIILVLVVLAISNIYLFLKPGTQSIFTVTSYETGSLTDQRPLTFLVNTDGTTVFMKNGATGQVVWSSSDASAVIVDAIDNATNGGRILIAAGVYTISEQITPSVGGIDLGGEGNATVLRASDNIVNHSGKGINDDVLFIYELSNFNVHDLQVDCNSAGQSQPGTLPELNGIDFWGTTSNPADNIVIERTYVHDCKSMGLQGWGTNYRILNNYVVNSGGDGVNFHGIVNTCSSACVPVAGGAIIADNVINGASDVGVDANTMLDAVYENNIVMNINLNTSPWGINSHDGMYLGDSGEADKVTFSRNVVNTATGACIISQAAPSLSNKDILIEGNQLTNCGGGIKTEYTVSPQVRNNIIDTTTMSNAPGAGIWFMTGTVTPAATGNMISNPSSFGILVQVENSLVSGNSINMTQAAPDETYAISIQASNSTVTNNAINLRNTGNRDIRGIHASHMYGTYVSNVVLGNAPEPADRGIQISGGFNTFISNSISNVQTCISGDNQPNITIINNTFVPAKGGISIGISGPQIGDVFKDNHGYNPRGHLTAIVDTANNLLSDNGDSSTFTNATTLTVSGSPKLIMITIGSGWTDAHALVIKVDGAQVVYTTTPTAHSTYTYDLSPGQSIYVQYQSDQATFIVSGQ